jgi:hypothetical protein
MTGAPVSGGCDVRRSLNLEPKMTKLTDTQLIVLSSACRNEDGLATCPENLKPAAAEKLAASLQGKGLVREIRCKPGAPVWREDGQGKTYSLKILKAGREAVGMPEEKVESTDLPAVAQPAAEVQPNATIRRTKSEATPAPVDPGVRAGSKRALIISLLQRTEGATLDDLIAATGWLPHTTRAALTGLRKTGLTIERSRPGQSSVSIYRIIPTATAAAA